MQFRLLGGLRVLDGAQDVDLGAPKQRAVLAALLLHDGRQVSADRLIDMVWGDTPPARPDASLQAYIANLRRALEPSRPARTPATVLVTGHAGYALHADPGDVDIRHVEHLAEGARQLLADGDTSAAVAQLDAVIECLDAPLLPELGDEWWVREAAARLASTRIATLEQRFEAGLSNGEDAALVPRLQAAITEHPFHERLRAQLALALYRTGRPRDALEVLAEARRFLADEAGLSAGPELAALETAILDHDERVLAPPTPSRPHRPAAPAPEDPLPALPTDGGNDVRPFVGREAELAVMHAAFGDVMAGRGRSVVVSGDAGAGKTRLVEEFLAAAGGPHLAWARCPETASDAPYWPLLEIAGQLEGNGLLEPIPDDVRPHEGDSDEDAAVRRLALHRTTVSLLRRVAKPVVVVIDDVHWADTSTLRLMEFVAGELHTTRVLLVVTTRPPLTDSPPALLDCLAELARSQGASRLDLGGLGTDDVARWLTARTGAPVPAAVCHSVHDRTGGNAFFVNEVVELLVADGRLVDADAVVRAGNVPAAVQDVVRRRVGRLPARTQQVLTAASVLGRAFDADVLAEVTELPALDLLDAVEPAIAARLVDEADDRPGRYSFSHAIVAETLVAELGAARRARIHAAATRALGSLRAADPDRYAADIARHALAGMAAGTADDAVTWSSRAATVAERQFADDDAALHWERTAAALAVARPHDRRARFDALLGQGRALMRADRVQEAYAVLLAAIDVAIEVGEPELIGRAAAATNAQGLWFAGEIGLLSVDAIGALERALAHMPDTPTSDRAMTLGSLADNAYWFWPVERIEQITAEAVDAARRAGDPATLARVLHKRQQALWRSSSLESRRRDTEEMMSLLSDGVLPLEMEVHARFDAAGVAWESGDVPAAMDLVHRARLSAAQLGAPALITQLDFFQSAIDIWRGELDAAERVLEEAYDLYRRTRKWAADTFRAGFRLLIVAERGDLEEIAALAPAIMESEYAPFFGEVFAFVHLLADDLDGARRHVRAVLPPDVDAWLNLGINVASLHTRAAVGDIDGVAALRDRILPYSGRLATIGTGPAIGDVDLALAVAARTLGDPDTARRYADASVALLSKNLAGPWLTRAIEFRDDLDRAAR